MGTDFPYLDEEKEFRFPPATQSTPEGIVALGGNLSPGMLLSAYRQGIFPWFSPGEPVLWWSPDPRFVLFPSNLHVSRSMRKVLNRNRFRISFDTAFSQVIEECKNIYRKGQNGTWITDSMKTAYEKLHELGYAHSVEVWQGEVLAGGLYGVSLGACFFGESMFSRVSNSSKAALITLARKLEERGFLFIDCQVYSAHLERLGAENISRERFLELLEEGLCRPTLEGKWDF
jgi:leucyl/phenylalanyl-tRNA--protein transferase